MRKVFITFILVVIYSKAIAFDFQIGYHQFTILSKEEKTVEMTKFAAERGLSVIDTIPATVDNDDVTYTVTTIGKEAYYYSRINGISIPNTIRKIKERAFVGCIDIIKVDITDMRAWCEIEFEDEYSNPVSRSESFYLNGSKVRELIIPEGIKTINHGAFLRCKSLYSVKLANSVEYIGIRAFDGCYNLNKLDLGSVQTIDEMAFYRCSAIKQLNIPKSTKHLDIRTFTGTDCSTITVDSENPYYDSRDNCNGIIETKSNMLYLGSSTTVIPNSVDSIGNYAFESCYGLKELVVPSNVKTIGLNAIHDCTYLTTMTMPALRQFRYLGGIGLENLNIMCKDEDDFMSFIGTFIPYYGIGPTCYPDYHFYINGKLLKELVIPEDMVKIYQLDFSKCPDIKKVTCYATNPPKVQYSSYHQSIKATLYVPEDAIDAYKSTEPWSQFTNIIPVDFSGINDIKNDVSTSVSRTYDIYGRQADSSTRGIVIKNGKKYIAN